MTIRFKCSCGKKLKAEDDNVGKKILCTGCGNPITVPSSSMADADFSIGKPKTEEEKKNKRRQAYEAEVRNKNVKVDYFGFAKELGRILIPGTVGIVVGFFVLYWLSLSMMSNKIKLPPLGRVEGIVTLDKKPLAGASVTFIPLDTKAQAAASTATTDDQGRYTLDYTPDYPGAAVGAHRVEVRKGNNEGIEQIHFMYNSRSELVENVKEGSQTIDIPLSTPQK